MTPHVVRRALSLLAELAASQKDDPVQVDEEALWQHMLQRANERPGKVVSILSVVQEFAKLTGAQVDEVHAKAIYLLKAKVSQKQLMRTGSDYKALSRR